MQSRWFVMILVGLGPLLAAGCETAAPESAPSDEVCETHEMRPDRYQLFEMVDVLKDLTQGIEAEEHEIYVIPGHWSDFWIAPQAGFEAAQEEMGFRGEFRAACDKADLTCVEDQMALFEELTDGSPDNGEASAIGLGCKDGAAMQPLVTEASARLPIITFDSDVANPLETGRKLYLGAMNQPAGDTAGQRLFNLFPEEGDVHLYGSNFTALNQIERAAGVFERCLDVSFDSGADFIASEYCSDLSTRHVCEAACVGSLSQYRVIAHSYDDEFEADEEWRAANDSGTPEEHLADSVTELIRGDSPPSAILCLNGTSSTILESVLSVENDGGNIRFVGWDLSEEIQAGLENRSVDGTMVQNAYFYGYLTAHIAYAMSAVGEERVMEVLEEYFDPGNEDKLLDTGMTFIGQETLPMFIEYQTKCLGLSSG